MGITGTRHVSVLLPVEDYQRLRQTAFEKNVSMNTIIREALREYLKAQE